MEENPSRYSRQIVYDFILGQSEGQELNPPLVLDEVFVVSFYTIGGSWRTIIETTLPDETYYEVGYNATRNRLYLSTYKKGVTYELGGKELTPARLAQGT